jgi:tRNA pseudouridine55 synthase
MLVIDKPLGASSFDVIRRLRRLLHTRALGHTGTLDPAATGVLCVCTGWALKLMQFFDDDRKSYRATVRLGQSTETDDSEGAIVEERPVDVSQADLEAALALFLGTIEQVPPAYSAIKVAGERAYAKARRGEDVALRARPVRIDRIDLVSYEAPIAVVDIDCGKGTYVRSVARDLGAALGCGAHLAGLRRTRSGVAEEGDAIGLDEVEARLASASGDLAALPWLDTWRLLDHLPSASLDDAGAAAIRQGKRVPAGVDGVGGVGSLVRVEASAEPGRLLAVARVAEGPAPTVVALQPVKVRPTSGEASG